MNSSEFTDVWKKISNVTMKHFNLRSPFAEGLSEASTEALTEYGLPAVAGTWLEFGEVDGVAGSIASAFDERNFFPIGKLGLDGFICIDKKNDSIAVFSQSEPDEPWLMNSSLNQLYESIVIFESFIKEVNMRNPHYHRDYRIPEGMLQELQNRLTSCDPVAMHSKSYWYCQISSLDDSAF